MRYTLGHRDSDRERGANLVELALILPLLLLLVAAVADFGRAFNSYIVINNAAREGARFAGRMYQTPSVDKFIRRAVIQEADNSGLDLEGVTEDSDSEVARITIEPVYTARVQYQPITVTVEYTISTFFAGIVGLDQIPMRSQSVMDMLGGYVAEP
ncbi:MAG: TadE/TadG family type IV pilus assembly protein [Anaerolineae bacterium]